MTELSMSGQLLFREAAKRGISCTIFGFSEHVILMEKAGKMWYTKGSRTSLESSVGTSISEKKEISKLLMQHFSIPTARFEYVPTESEISKISKLKFPLVMKPVDGLQGKGVVVGIKTLAEALNFFKAQEKKVLFEEMLQGTEYRILCIDSKFFAASYRKPAYVLGNGKDTIQSLIEKKNAHPSRGEAHTKPLSKIVIDDFVLRALTEQGFGLDSVPGEGFEVRLRKTANLSTGGEAWDVTEEVSEENKELFEKIARISTLNTVGIDVMCGSLSIPIAKQQKAGIIEINDSPGLRMHHFPSKGKSRNAAGAILDMVERKLGI